MTNDKAPGNIQWPITKARASRMRGPRFGPCGLVIPWSLDIRPWKFLASRAAATERALVVGALMAVAVHAGEHGGRVEKSTAPEAVFSLNAETVLCGEGIWEIFWLALARRLSHAGIEAQNWLNTIMSLWRKEASRRLPELQASIASSEVKSPSDLWMQLRWDFQKLCNQEPPPIDLLSRIWHYARWSAEHQSEKVQFAVIAHFFENIEDTRCHREVLTKFMSQDEYETVCGLRAPPNP